MQIIFIPEHHLQIICSSLNVAADLQVIVV